MSVADFTFTNVISPTNRCARHNVRNRRCIAETNLKHTVVNARREEKLVLCAYLTLTITVEDWL